MPRLVWLSDIHLDAAKDDITLPGLCRRISETRPDAIVISGDIGTARTYRDFLETIHREAGAPIFFVHGNHDFYDGSISVVRQDSEELTHQDNGLTWLPVAGIVKITPKTCLLGHDGWADGRAGDYWKSGIVMRDFQYIREIPATDKARRLRVMKGLAEETNQYLSRHLPAALRKYDHVIFVTHVPPFVGATWHRGRPSAPEILPYYCSKSTGDLLLRFMRSVPEKTLTVLCGHTHGRGRFQPVPNVMVKTAGAEYGRPQIQDIVEIRK
jgi:3',5'-cyclic-AMP phosphodiesterase